MQPPQSLRTPEHSAVAKLKRELTDERKKLQVQQQLTLCRMASSHCRPSNTPISNTPVTGCLVSQVLTKANQQSVDKMTEYKERYRGLKSAVSDRDKQLDLAKRTIERLSGHCNAMEVSRCLPLSHEHN